MRSAVILAGGAGSRLGEEKSLIEFCGRPLILWLEERLGCVADEVVVVARDKEQARIFCKLLSSSAVACDSISGYGPVAGLAAGMEWARGEYVLALGCDLPFISAQVIERLFELAAGFDAAVPVGQEGMMEPLHAVYRRERLLWACKEAISQGERRIRLPLSMLAVNWVAVELLRPLDPELRSFFNLNSRDDLELARRLWSK